jgi:hypothetical protein
MEITGIYDLNVSLDNNNESVKQRFFIVPQLTETCILGIDFIIDNAMILDGETRRVTYKINGRNFSFAGETQNSNYKCLALIQKLNDTVAKSMKNEENSERKLDSPASRIVIEDVNSEIYRSQIDCFLKKNKDVIADKNV